MCKIVGPGGTYGSRRPIMPTQRRQTLQLPIPHLNQPGGTNSRPVKKATMLEAPALLDANVQAEVCVGDKDPCVFLGCLAEKAVEDVGGGDVGDFLAFRFIASVALAVNRAFGIGVGV